MSAVPNAGRTPALPRARRMSAASLVAHQARYDLRAFRRNTRARIFTLAVPVVLLLILVSLFRGGTVKAGGVIVDIAAYYVPHIAAMAIVGAGLINLLITIVAKRESGSLKRHRATPVPAWVLIAGDATTSVVSAVVIVAVLVAIGSIGFGLNVTGAALGLAAVETVIGAAAFCCLAYALSGLAGIGMHRVVRGHQLGDVNEVARACGLASTRICHTAMLAQPAAFLPPGLPVKSPPRVVRRPGTSRRASAAPPPAPRRPSPAGRPGSP